MASRIWRNWSRIQQCAPARIHKPISEEELVRIVKRAASDGRRVKAVGAGHSFTGIALTDGHLIDLSDYNTVLSTDTENRTVTVQSGIPLHQLNDQLWDNGLATQNLGGRCLTAEPASIWTL